MNLCILKRITVWINNLQFTNNHRSRWCLIHSGGLTSGGTEKSPPVLPQGRDGCMSCEDHATPSSSGKLIMSKQPTDEGRGYQYFHIYINFHHIPCNGCSLNMSLTFFNVTSKFSNFGMLKIPPESMHAGTILKYPSLTGFGSSPALLGVIHNLQNK